MKKIIHLLLLSLIIMSCSEENSPKSKNQNVEFNKWLDSVWLAKVNRYPTLQTEYGFHTNDDKWDDISDETRLKEYNILTGNIKELDKRFDVNNLYGEALLSYKIYLYNVEMELGNAKYIYNEFPVSQMDGWHTKIPSILINQQKIENEKDALNYIKRVETAYKVLEQLTQNLKNRAEKNIVAPKFILNYVINSCNNLTVNSANSIENHPIHKDFYRKLSGISLSKDKKVELESKLDQAINNSFSPAYQRFVGYLKELEQSSSKEIGVWALKNGDNYYKYLLKLNNTIDITPDEVYNLGISEVERIHQEMIKIKDKVGFKGDLQAFFKFMRDNPRFYLPNTEKGKEIYLDSARAIINTMKAELPKLFNVLPKTDLIVKAVEPFREKSAGTAFYEPPSLDGKRPGIYYVNLYDMHKMPTYQMEALAYHEGIPGHHMQIAIAQELKDIPKFRIADNYYVSYVEGWGLYAEELPKEIGFYSDPYSDFGRLAMELWRACRLVVDVGIHVKKWSRQQAIDYYNNNTPASNAESVGMVDRHIVMPGQATGYKIGMNYIMKLREKAKKTLKDKFDIKAFHDIVLKDGPIPLFILSDKVDEWIDSESSQSEDNSGINEVETKVITNPGLGM